MTNCKVCDGTGLDSETIYGLFPGGDPRNFCPDDEVCSPEEIARWEVACTEWGKGQGIDRGPSCLTKGDGSAYTGKGFGIGTYQYKECLECGGTGHEQSQMSTL